MVKWAIVPSCSLCCKLLFTINDARWEKEMRYLLFNSFLFNEKWDNGDYCITRLDDKGLIFVSFPIIDDGSIYVAIVVDGKGRVGDREPPSFVSLSIFEPVFNCSAIEAAKSRRKRNSRAANESLPRDTFPHFN